GRRGRWVRAFAPLDTTPGPVACWPWRASTPDLQHSAPARVPRRGKGEPTSDVEMPVCHRRWPLLGNVQPAVSGRQLQMTSDAGFKRRVRRRMAKTGEAYTTARARLDRRAPTAATRRVLHVTNGDSVAGTLAASGVAGQVLAWRDVLCDGPVPGGLTPQELRRVRAEHLAARYERDVAVIDEELAKRDHVLDTYAKGEYRLWFEADLHDQLQL